MNAKPDTSIQLLEGRKKITLAEIRDLNERIQRKLQNHDLIGQIASPRWRERHARASAAHLLKIIAIQ